MAEKGSQGVSYTNVSSDYFDKRGLERHAGLLALWALGVAAVISGDFSGWNFGIAEAGWGGLFIATILVIIMYYGMLFSIGENASPKNRCKVAPGKSSFHPLPPKTPRSTPKTPHRTEP